MKKMLFFFLISLGFSTQGICGKCDTIDVYYNKTLLGKINEYESGKIYILNGNLDRNDSITITYSGDPIGAYLTLSIRDTMGRVIQELKSLNTGFSRKLFSFSLYSLLPVSYSGYKTSLLFSFGGSKWLFKLKLE